MALSNQGTNKSGNFGNGEYPMPTPANASEADVAINMSNLIKGAASDGMGISEGMPPRGGNPGYWSDGLPKSDAQKG